MHNNKQNRQGTQNFPQGNHKGENPATSFEIEWAPMAAVKPKNIKMISNNLFSLSHLRELLLSHSCAPVSVCVCVINRESHYLFIFLRSLNVHSNISAPLNNYLLGPTSLEESNNPSAPQLWGLSPSNQQGGLTLTQWWGLLPQLTINHLRTTSLG